MLVLVYKGRILTAQQGRYSTSYAEKQPHPGKKPGYCRTAEAEPLDEPFSDWTDNGPDCIACCGDIGHSRRDEGQGFVQPEMLHISGDVGDQDQH